MQHEELIERLRDGVPCADPDAGNGEGSFYIDDANETMCEAADALQSQAARIAALIAAVDKLAGFAAHDSECALGLHGPTCSCGLDKAQQAWREARDQ